MHHRQEFKVFCGNANPSLAQEITRFLHTNMGKADVSKFANGETGVVIHESIRSHDVYIVQSVCANLNQINFLKHAKANSNSNLNTSIRSPKDIQYVEEDECLDEPPASLTKVPSNPMLSRTASGRVLPDSLNNTTPNPLALSNSLLEQVKALSDNTTTMYSPELAPLRFPREQDDVLSPVLKSTPLLPVSPRQPPHTASTTTTPSTPAHQATASHTTTPSTPAQPQAATTSPVTPLAVQTAVQAYATPSKPLRSPRSLPTSPSSERLIISHSTSKDIDQYNWSVNDSLMELLVMGDAFKRASCRQLIAVIPFFGYARQSKKHKSRTPITAKLMANMLQTAGFDRIITVDMHASQIQGFFDVPVDNLFAEASIVKYIRKRIPGDKIVVAPGVGGVKRAKSVADKLDTELAILHAGINHENAKQLVLVGDVKDKVALIIDDIADTCETLEQATYTLIEKGAKKVYALVTHGVLSDRALERLIAMPLTELVITNSIPNDYNLSQCSKIKVINLGPLLGEAIRRTNFGESLSTYFFAN